MFLVKLIGIFIGCMGFMVVMNPGIMQRMLAYWRQGKRIYLGGLIRLLFGMAFLLSASQARVPVVVVVFGILFLITGTLALVLGLEKTKVMLTWWDARPRVFMRLMGFLVLAMGACIIYAAL